MKTTTETTTQTTLRCGLCGLLISTTNQAWVTEILAIVGEFVCRPCWWRP